MGRFRIPLSERKPLNPDLFVTARRKKDGWHVHPIGGMTPELVTVSSRQRAESIIRIDLGCDLDEFDIQPYKNGMTR